MKIFISLTVAFLIACNMSAQVFQWGLQGGGSGSSNTSDRGEAVATDSQGNTIVTGIFEGTAVFGTTTLTSAGINDIFIAKYSPAGNLIWAIKAGGSQIDWVKAICTDKNDNIIITGQFSGTATFGTTSITASSIDIFTAKYNSNGVLQWVKKEGGSSVDRGLSVAADTSGNIFVTGDFSGNATFGSGTLNSAGAADLFLIKYNPAGTMQWSRRIGNAVNDRGNALTTDTDGNVYVAGSFGGTITVGTTTLTATGGSNDTDILLVKYNTSGTPVWAKKGGSTAGVVEEARGIGIDNSGNIYVTGLFGGTASFDGISVTSLGASDAFVVKYNNNGVAQWAQSGGGVNDDEGMGICVFPDGKSCITGFYMGAATFGTISFNAYNGASDYDAFASCYSSNGNLLWAKSFGRTGEDRAASISVSPDKQMYITGFFRNTILFDNIQLTSQGYSDMFLAKINDFLTLSPPLFTTLCPKNDFALSYTATNNFASGNVFNLWLSDASGSFTSPTLIGSLNSTTSGTINGLIPAGTPSGNNYLLKLEATNPQTFSAPSSQAFTINPVPPAPQIITPVAFCEGDTLKYIKVTGNWIFWYNDTVNNVAFFTGDSLWLNVPLSDDTVFYCRDTTPSACYSNFTSVNIQLNPLPQIAFNGTDTMLFCENGLPYLPEFMPAGGILSGQGITSPGSTFYPALAGTGWHTITYDYTNSFSCSASYNVFFEVMPPLQVSIDTTPQLQLAQGDIISLTGSPAGGTFSGAGMNGNTFTADTNTLNCNPCMIYYIFEDANGCSDTASIEITILTDIDEHNLSKKWNVFPNPASDYISVSGSITNSAYYHLFDAQGRLLKQEALNSIEINHIPLKSFENGVYFLRVSDANTTQLIRIIKL